MKKYTFYQAVALATKTPGRLFSRLVDPDAEFYKIDDYHTFFINEMHGGNIIRKFDPRAQRNGIYEEYPMSLDDLTFDFVEVKYIENDDNFEILESKDNILYPKWPVKDSNNNIGFNIGELSLNDWEIIKVISRRGSVVKDSLLRHVDCSFDNLHLILNSLEKRKIITSSTCRTEFSDSEIFIDLTPLGRILYESI